jgi:DNA-binding MarR family transcriptional regulator
MKLADTVIDPPAEADAKSQRSLSDFLCFAIYSANLAFGKAYKPMLEALGITYTQWIILVALWERDNESVRALGERLFLESNTLTPILKKLEEMGYLVRRRDSSDERQVLISLTPAGRSLREEGGHWSLLDATGLTPDEFKAVQKTISRVRDNLLVHAKGDAAE